ncbi:MAG: hypothetical protein ACFFAN_17605 [Promethearchaeota archaeon]
MKPIKDWFEEIKNSNNYYEINDFLIEIGKTPNKESLFYINHFMDNLKLPLFEKIKINIVYNLGEIGQLIKLEDNQIDKLYTIYYESDRWVRNEAIQAFEKISKIKKLSEKVIKLITLSLGEEYIPIIINSLKLLKNLEIVPDFTLTKILFLLNSDNPQILELCTDILEKYIPNENKLFELLDHLQIYKILNKKAIRSLILMSFNSIIPLESFRKLILNSNWDLECKKLYYKEIDTYQKLLMKYL